jgi:hypothetical protein
MAMAAYIIGMQKIASLASPKKRVVEQGFLEFFQDDGQTGSYRFVGLVSINALLLIEVGANSVRGWQPGIPPPRWGEEKVGEFLLNTC